VRQGYLELARRFDRIVILDGSESPAALLAQALQIIVRRRYTVAL
jgi:thymidylate kinase